MTKYEKSADYIYNVIKEEYANLESLVSSKDIVGDLELLVENRIAYKISDIIPFAGGGCNKYKIVLKFLKERDETLSKHEKYHSKYGYNYKINNVAGKSQYINDLYNEPEINDGTYYINLSSKDKEDYAVLIVEGEDPNKKGMGKFTVYFIGDRASKFIKKLYKLFDERDRIFEEEDLTDGVIINGIYKESKFKSFDEVVMKDKEEYIRYIDNWIEHIPEYYNSGMIPKLSILIYGEPGTGKSTFCRALAKHLGIHYVMPIMPDYFDKDTGNNNKHNYTDGEPVVFVIDDIDCICKSRDIDSSKENNDRTARLLSYLDEPDTFLFKAKDGKFYPISIITATTNYYDKLDKAVKRYGRFDLQIEMNNFGKKEAENMCSLYNLKLKDVYDKEITKDFTISPSYLQALCMKYIDKSLKKVK